MLYYDRQFTRESKIFGMKPEEYLAVCAKKNNKTKEEMLYIMASKLVAQLNSLKKPMESHEFKSLISYLEFIAERHEAGYADCSAFISGVYQDIAISYEHQEMLRKISFPMKFVSDEIIFKNYEKAITIKHNNYLALTNMITFCFLKCDFTNTKLYMNKLFNEWEIIKDKMDNETFNYFNKLFANTVDILTSDMYAFMLPLKIKDYNLLCGSEKIVIYEDLLDFYKNRYYKFDNAVSVNKEEFVLFNILGSLYQYAGDYHKAYSVYKNWITILPEFYQPYTNLSLLNLRLNTPESGKKAEEYALKGLELLKNSKEILSEKKYMYDYYSLNINLTGALALQEKYEEMKLLIDRLLSEHQRNYKMNKEQLNSCYHHLGTFYFKTEQYKQAEKFTQKALDLYPDESSYELMGNIFDKEEKKKIALMYYKSAYKFARKYVVNKNDNFDITSIICDDKDRIKNLLLKIIRTCQQVKDFNQAKEYLAEAKKYYKEDADFIELEVDLCSKMDNQK